MKELKTLKPDDTLMNFMETYNYNKGVVGGITVRKDVYSDFIKVLCIFPLKDKKLKYFLGLTSKQKTGYMSSYIMKLAKKLNVPNALIKLFQEKKEMAKLFKVHENPEEMALLLREDPKKFLYEYKLVVKEEIYRNELSKLTNVLCSSIFEQYDKIKLQLLKEEQLL